MQRLRKLRSVSFSHASLCRQDVFIANFALLPLLAKFTNYQYGGRPLGLSFVKYLAQDGSDPMQGGEGMEGMTQDQTM